MHIQETELKPASSIRSGSVRRFALPNGMPRITQVTTFCPDVIGPGPTHLYLVESDALVLVDAGIPTALAQMFFYHWRNQPMPKEVEVLAPDHSEQEFVQGVDTAKLSPKDIELLVFTHGHPDHFLMARAILERCNASVSVHIRDTPEICNPWGMLNSWYARVRQMGATGMPAPRSMAQGEIRQELHGLNLESLGLSVTIDAPLFDEGPLHLNGAALPHIGIIHIPGHTPGSVGLLIGESPQRVLLCGDVLLDPISPHPDELLTYLRTLEYLDGMSGSVALALPAHGQPIRDLRGRVAALREHHRTRLRLTYDACAVPRSVWGIASMPNYFDTYVDPKRFNMMAATEVLAHVELLAMVRGVARADIREGIHYFLNSGEPFEEVYARIRTLVTESNTVPMLRC
jgi:glyoxylase-like metal-dependent hydrolase (beta-lactamase superfamily II)